jgi:probable F420-dependent oxidoreductase
MAVGSPLASRSRELVKFGVALGALNPRVHEEATLVAEQHGFESVWLPEHLVFTRAMSGSPHPGVQHPPVPPDTPIYDAFAYLAYLAARTERIRLGTHVFNIGLRHPFTVARGVQTVDLLSRGRFEFGIGASWLEEEWRATGLDFATRGRRVDEAIDVCKRLWTEETVTHHGEFFSFDDVVFEPKPVQKPWPPILVGGESKTALRRATRLGDGWLGMGHTFESAAAQIEYLRVRLGEQGRQNSEVFQITLGGAPASRADVIRWETLGVTRMIVSPWRRSSEAIDGLRRFAHRMFG